jgi:hypothetical protein
MNNSISAASIPNNSNITGITQDPHSDLLYISTTSGYIFTWNEASNYFVSHINIGRPLSSIDISADGNTLAVGEYSGNLDEYGGSPITSVGLVTLSNSNVQTLTLAQTSTSEGGVAGVGWDANGNLLVTTDGQWVPYHFIPAGSQSFGAATVAGSSALSSASFLETTADHRYVLALEGDITGAPLDLYDTQAGKIIASTGYGYALGTDGFNVGTGDINDTVGLIADIIGNAVYVLNFSLQHVAGPGTTDSIIGAHFNASGNTLYLWDATSKSILIYDTATWLETGSIAVSISAQPSGVPLQPSGQMSLSEDGRYLVLLTGASGFDSIDLSTAPITQTGNGLGDTVSGSYNANNFIVVKGTNNFVGTGSQNTVVFDLPFADYSVTRQADNSLVVSSSSVGEGPDHLIDIQTLQFTDATAQISASGQLTVQATAASAAGIAAGGSDILGVAISDSAANVAKSLDALQSIAASGKLSAITLTDGGTPTLTITAAQLTADATALKDISGSFALIANASAANVTITGLAGHVNTVLFGGSASQYSIAPTGDGASFTVTDTGTGRTSVDHLNDITQVLFADKTVTIAANNSVNENIALLY